MYQQLFLAAAIVSLTPQLGFATIRLGRDTNGTVELQPDLPNQQIPVFADGADLVAGMNLRVQIGDGGSAVYGTDRGAPADNANIPGLTGIDLLTDTIFGAAGGTESGGFGIDEEFSYLIGGLDVALPMGEVVADGQIATLTFDTTGITGDVVATLLFEIPGQEITDFAGTPTELSSARLRIVGSNPLPCDFDANGVCELLDIDALLYVGLTSQDTLYDLDNSGTVDLADRNAVLSQIDSLPGDFDLSGATNAADLNLLAQNWQRSATSFASGDANGDRTVDAADLNDLARWWQGTASDFRAIRAVAAVPEPQRATRSWIVVLAVLYLRTRAKTTSQHPLAGTDVGSRPTGHGITTL